VSLTSILLPPSALFLSGTCCALPSKSVRTCRSSQYRNTHFVLSPSTFSPFLLSNKALIFLFIIIEDLNNALLLLYFQQNKKGESLMSSLLDSVAVVIRLCSSETLGHRYVQRPAPDDDEQGAVRNIDRTCSVSSALLCTPTSHLKLGTSSPRTTDQP
jgi:hypothetical protein